MSGNSLLSGLPSGWVRTTVGDVFTVVGGGTPSTTVPSYWTGNIPWITSADIDGVRKVVPRKSISEDGVLHSATNVVPPHAVIVVTRVGLGKVGLAGQRLAFSQDCQGLISDPVLVNPEFAAYQLLQRVQAFKYMSRGTTISGVTKKQLLDLPFDLAPTAEQRRIVAAIEEQFSRIDAGVEALQRARRNLQRMRAAVLQAAVTGQLVPQDPDDEPAEVLLKRILEERRSVHGIGRRGDHTAVEGDLYDVPVGWCWATLDQLAAAESHAITDGPFGSNLKTSHYTESGPRVIRLQNIGQGVFIEGRAHISTEHYERLKKHAVAEGDLVIAALGDDLPRACPVPKEAIPAIVKADCVRFRPHTTLDVVYLNLALNAPPTKARVSSIIHGVGRPRLNLREIKSIALPLPPALEQERIAAEASRNFSIIEAIDGQISTMIDRSNQLRRAVLARAFYGRLVPQDPSDEPASALLGRITAARNGQETKAQRQPRRSRR